MPVLAYGQDPDFEKMLEEWTFLSEGNPIDGFSRSASRALAFEGYDAEVFLFQVRSTASSIEIKNSTGNGNENGDRDDVFISLKGNEDFLNGVDKVLMFFDNEKPVYVVHAYNHSDRECIYLGAIAADNSSYLSKFDFINKLKNKNRITFRFVYLNRENLQKLYDTLQQQGLYTKSFDEFVAKYVGNPNEQENIFKEVAARGLYSKTRQDFKAKYFPVVQPQKNVSFELNGSATAINKVVDISNIIKSDDESSDYHMDLTRGVMNFTYEVKANEILTKDLDEFDIQVSDYSDRLIELLKERFGDYVFCVIISCVYSDGEMKFFDVNEKLFFSVSISEVLNE